LHPNAGHPERAFSVILRVCEDFRPMGSIQWAEIGGVPFCHPERRLPESKDLAAAIFAAVMSAAPA
jgi:hypothetical protein